jgi:hypothetical protein
MFNSGVKREWEYNIKNLSIPPIRENSMPSKASLYRDNLRQCADWPAFIRENSNLPGPRGNLELAEAVAAEGGRPQFEQLLHLDGPDIAENTPEMFVVFCGIVGLGKLIAGGQMDWTGTLRHYANDPRWRIREGCAMALQRIGAANMNVLFELISPWAAGTRLEQRAVAAGLCEPALLKPPEAVQHTLELLDQITKSLLNAPDLKSDDFKSLRQTLGYGWSVAAAADFSLAQPYLEKWLQSPDGQIRWVMRENLTKKRLERAAPAWTAAWRERLSAAA